MSEKHVFTYENIPGNVNLDAELFIIHQSFDILCI